MKGMKLCVLINPEKPGSRFLGSQAHFQNLDLKMIRANYARTFFWILITRFVREVICFFRALTISVTDVDRAATASAASCAAAVAASAASAAALAASVAAFAASVASAAASAAAVAASDVAVSAATVTSTELIPAGASAAPRPVWLVSASPAAAAVTATAAAPVPTLPAASAV
jgi:hypothetical protein